MIVIRPCGLCPFARGLKFAGELQWPLAPAAGLPHAIALLEGQSTAERRKDRLEFKVARLWATDRATKAHH